jgi:hypothetical protein
VSLKVWSAVLQAAGIALGIWLGTLLYHAFAR